ncbi:MAG: aminotransferase class I/II-fold pyridoxal phosphate-dependent enzyme [Bacteroidetes bacterium]|nr:aminotransferase class I/II-fold pyridoxal phosphate-dependent enzyme [Bacteroidota bacterium]MBU1113930.1 aminotransferase class I/II-fold pyridoxal phosphate-dependent enzyme [Bacteroidota bacterium]MBU1798249.1 aminotransferase class I/II-fold pyridoxal phosphate-dependent enzyme [Bacteroidota bacterium]
MSEEKKTKIDESKYSLNTQIIYGKNVTNKWDYSHHVVAPLSSSNTFKLDSVDRGALGFIQFAQTEKQSDGHPILIYDRLGEPNKDMLEENLAHIENGEMAVSFATGMGAISGVLGVLTKTGDEIITHSTLYGCTISLFNNWYPRYNIAVHPTDLTNAENILKFANVKTRVIYFETPANPNMDIINLEEVRNIVDELNKNRNNEDKIQIVVDNTFATPYCQRPIKLGADFTVHSLTKGLNGFGTDMGGIVIGRNEFRDKILLYRKDFGAVLNTKSAWTVLTYGLPSLVVRQQQQVSTAQKVAEYLEAHPKVEKVNYPGLKSFKYYELAKKQMTNFEGEFAPGTLLYFLLNGDSPADCKAKGAKFIDYCADNSYTMTLAVSLGHTRTLIEHPPSMTHSVVPPEKLAERGIDPGGIRLAFGLEKAEDIIMDLEKALENI